MLAQQHRKYYYRNESSIWTSDKMHCNRNVLMKKEIKFILDFQQRGNGLTKLKQWLGNLLTKQVTVKSNSKKTD